MQNSVATQNPRILQINIFRPGEQLLQEEVLKQKEEQKQVIAACHKFQRLVLLRDPMITMAPAGINSNKYTVKHILNEPSSIIACGLQS